MSKIDSVKIEGLIRDVVGDIDEQTCEELVREDGESYPGYSGAASLRDITQAQADRCAIDDSGEWFCVYTRNGCVDVTKITDQENIDVAYPYGHSEIAIWEDTVEAAGTDTLSLACAIREYGEMCVWCGIAVVPPSEPWNRRSLDGNTSGESLADLVEACREVWGDEFAELQREELGL